MNRLDERIVRATQAGLPLVPHPYRQVAERIGISETKADLDKVSKDLIVWESRMGPERHAAVRDALAAKQQQLRQAK